MGGISLNKLTLDLFHFRKRWPFSRRWFSVSWDRWRCWVQMATALSWPVSPQTPPNDDVPPHNSCGIWRLNKLPSEILCSKPKNSTKKFLSLDLLLVAFQEGICEVIEVKFERQSYLETIDVSTFVALGFTIRVWWGWWRDWLCIGIFFAIWWGILLVILKAVLLVGWGLSLKSFGLREILKRMKKVLIFAFIWGFTNLF